MSELGPSETVVTTAPSPSTVSVGHAPAISLISSADQNWRAVYESNPMTAVTNAILNIHAGGDDPSSQYFLYDNYTKIKQDPLTSDGNHATEIWPANSISNSHQARPTNGELSEVLSPLPQASKLQPVIRRGEPKSKLSHNVQRYGNGDSLSPSESAPIPTSGGVIIVKEEPSVTHSPGSTSPRMNGIMLPSATPLTPAASVSPCDDHPSYSHPLFTNLNNPATHPTTYDYGSQNSVAVSSPSQFSQGIMRTPGGIYTVEHPGMDPYYSTYLTDFVPSRVSKQLNPYDSISSETTFDRFTNNRSAYKPPSGGLSVDLPSPDSGIGPEAITPRDHSVPQGFEYEPICHPGIITEINPNSSSGRNTPAPQQKSARPWHHDFGRQNEADKIQIPKLYSNYGFRYYLESPISTSQRREDDRITYINKGQFYGISLEYILDAEKPLKSQTVKTVVMLVFREEKSPEDEIKAWQFWHGRQHSVKQRILDADTKNSVGLAGCIDEVAHNAIAIYWNPHESTAKINVAVQCLSTDFSSQKGVKGLPLHLQIDTYDDPRDPNCPIYHRAYCQIKVFCDKVSTFLSIPAVMPSAMGSHLAVGFCT
ncbi:unnamed protein product [Allacma fusca]|uniref:Grh/CP2 DB domain-containing protein n=1 Tax=Allacma fusca TaxID=39272 RepID=A0A8J2KCZ4_9HEXA|nr:unnamed protein product [Allacma fusca]